MAFGDSEAMRKVADMLRQRAMRPPTAPSPMPGKPAADERHIGGSVPECRG